MSPSGDNRPQKLPFEGGCRRDTIWDLVAFFPKMACGGPWIRFGHLGRWPHWPASPSGTCYWLSGKALEVGMTWLLRPISPVLSLGEPICGHIVKIRSPVIGESLFSRGVRHALEKRFSARRSNQVVNSWKQLKIAVSASCNALTPSVLRGTGLSRRRVEESGWVCAIQVSKLLHFTRRSAQFVAAAAVLKWTALCDWQIKVTERHFGGPERSTRLMSLIARGS